MPTVPIDSTINEQVPLPPALVPKLKDWGDPNYDGDAWTEFEEHVDKHIANKRLKEGDTFKAWDPSGVKTYRYLGPNSGGRKDWMEVPINPNAPSS